MAEPDNLKFDPSRTPFTTPALRFTYIENHPQAGRIKIARDTMEVFPIPHSLYPNMPLKLPKEIWERDQVHIGTCSYPGPRNRGCDSASNGGCPLISKYGRGAGPFNLILEKDGRVDSFPCFAAYCGVSDAGRPTSQVHMLMDGWQIIIDRTTTKDITPAMVNGVKQITELVREVPDLAPFYEEAKVGRFATPEVPKKKRGRPRKVDAGIPA